MRLAMRSMAGLWRFRQSSASQAPRSRAQAPQSEGCCRLAERHRQARDSTRAFLFSFRRSDQTRNHHELEAPAESRVHWIVCPQQKPVEPREIHLLRGQCTRSFFPARKPSVPNTNRNTHPRYAPHVCRISSGFRAAGLRPPWIFNRIVQ